MLRLRTTVTLSALALALGVAGTGWLSTLTGSGYVASPRVAHASAQRAAATALAHAPRQRPTRARRVQVQTNRASQTDSYGARGLAVAEDNPRTPQTTTPELVPLTTPADTSLTWEQLRGHLDGQVLLQVSVDNSGRVNAASVAQSSGDELLDAHALRSVWRWRFAIPEGSVTGMRGEVPVRYSSRHGAP